MSFDNQIPQPREQATRAGFKEYVLRQVARRWFSFVVAVLLVTAYLAYEGWPPSFVSIWP